MKSLVLAVLVFAGIAALSNVAGAAPIRTCYKMGLQFPDALDGSGKKDYLPLAYKLCVTEKNVVQESTHIASGDFSVQIIDGDFVQKGWGAKFRAGTATMQNKTLIFANTEHELRGEVAKRITFSFLKNASGAGTFLGQVSIAGSVYALYGL